MKTAFYTGASGLVAYQESMDVIGNNIANVNTTGYKAQKTAFSQLLATRMNTNEDPPLVGTGVRTVYKGIDASGGALIASEGSMDLAISGDGWFCVESGSQKKYTRDGNFSISLSGTNAYLVNQSGDFVLDSTGKQISAAVDAKKSTVDTDALLDKVGVFTFTNPEALTPVSSNCYLENNYTGAAKAATKGECTVIKGYLEQADVSLTDEMVALITAQRGYQISARIVQTADEVEQASNSLRG